MLPPNFLILHLSLLERQVPPPIRWTENTMLQKDHVGELTVCFTC